jgi:hypothetical protein
MPVGDGAVDEREVYEKRDRSDGADKQSPPIDLLFSQARAFPVPQGGKTF